MTGAITDIRVLTKYTFELNTRSKVPSADICAERHHNSCDSRHYQRLLPRSDHSSNARVGSRRVSQRAFERCWVPTGKKPAADADVDVHATAERR